MPASKKKPATTTPRIVKPSHHAQKAPRGGGVGKKTKRAREQEEEARNVKIRKPHRFRPGTVALRQIRAYQRSTEPLLRRKPFERIAREVIQDSIMLTDDTLRVQRGALEALQAAAEQELVQLFQAANVAAIHSRRVTVMPRDFATSYAIRGILSSGPNDARYKPVGRNAVEAHSAAEKSRTKSGVKSSKGTKSLKKPAAKRKTPAPGPKAVSTLAASASVTEPVTDAAVSAAVEAETSTSGAAIVPSAPEESGKTANADEADEMEMFLSVVPRGANSRAVKA